MPRPLRQSTAVDVPIGPFQSPTDGTIQTGLTITQPDVQLKKNAANWAQKSAAQTLAHETNGFYEVSLSTTDTDTLGLLRLSVNETGALPVWEDFVVMSSAVYDALYSTGFLQVDVTRWLTGTPNVLATGRVDASVGAMAANTLTATAIAASALNGKGDWNIGKTGYALSAAGAQAIWDVLDSVILVANSIGVRLKTFVDVAISSRSTYAGADTAGTTTLLSRIIGTLAAGTHQPQSGDSFTLVDPEVAAIKVKTDQLVFTTANRVDSTVVDKTGFALSTAGNNSVRDAVTDDIIETQGNYTLQQALSTLLAVIAGRTDTGGLVFRSPNGVSVRVTATVNGVNERTGITLTPSA